MKTLIKFCYAFPVCLDPAVELYKMLHEVPSSEQHELLSSTALKRLRGGEECLGLIMQMEV